MMHPVSSQIMSVSPGELSFARQLETIAQQAKSNAVVLCVEKADAHTVIEGLNSEQLSYTEGAVDWKKPGIYVCSLPFAEGFQCLLEHIIVYTRRELFPKEKKLVRYHAKFKEASVL